MPIAVGVLAAALLFAARNALVPFLLGALAAYICAPAATRLSRHMSRPAAAALLAVLTMLLLLAVPLLIVPVLAIQIFEVLQLLPTAAEGLWTRISALAPQDAGLDDFDVAGLLPNLGKAAGSAAAAVTGLLSWLGSGLAALAGALATLLIMPLVMFYLLADWDGILGRGRMLLPESVRGPALEVLEVCDQVLSEFLRAQLLVIVIMMIVYTLLLAAAGVPHPAALGAISGLLVFIPYAGFAVGLLLTLTVTALDFSGYAALVWAAGAMTLGAVIESLLITPWLIGDRIGLGPVSVLLALAIMGSIFGFVGMLAAIPVAAIVAALLRRRSG